MSWSARGILASCSIDNNILVWGVVDAVKRGKAVLAPLHVLSGHASFVKGISFDPIGKYLASCGTDGVVVLWDCNTWTQAKRLDGETLTPTLTLTLSLTLTPTLTPTLTLTLTLTGAENAAPDKNMFRRLDWAPDGCALCVSSAVKNNKVSANLLPQP